MTPRPILPVSIESGWCGLIAHDSFSSAPAFRGLGSEDRSDRIISSFPGLAVLFQKNVNSSAFPSRLGLRRQIGEAEIDRADVRGLGIAGGGPLIGRPADRGSGRQDEAEFLSGAQAADLMPEVQTSRGLPTDARRDVAPVGRIHPVKADPVAAAADEREVFGMRPAERRSRAGGPARAACARRADRRRPRPARAACRPRWRIFAIVAARGGAVAAGGQRNSAPARRSAAARPGPTPVPS